MVSSDGQNPSTLPTREDQGRERQYLHIHRSPPRVVKNQRQVSGKFFRLMFRIPFTFESSLLSCYRLRRRRLGLLRFAARSTVYSV